MWLGQIPSSVSLENRVLDVGCNDGSSHLSVAASDIMKVSIDSLQFILAKPTISIFPLPENSEIRTEFDGVLRACESMYDESRVMLIPNLEMRDLKALRRGEPCPCPQLPPPTPKMLEAMREIKDRYRRFLQLWKSVHSAQA